MMQLNMLAGAFGYIVMIIGLIGVLVCYTLYKRKNNY